MTDGVRRVLSGEGRWHVECVDCIEFMRTLPDGCVDAVVTDPPYSETIHAGARGQRPGVNRLNTEKLVDFDSIDETFFLQLCRESVRVAARWVVMTCDWRHAACAEREMPSEFIRNGVWIKPDGAPQFTGDRPGVGWEAILLLHRKGKKRWNGGGHHAVWTHHVHRGNVHPTQKPLALVRRWIESFTDPNEVILDPFLGSGTTGIACMHTGRRFLGCELDPGYFEIARKRIDEAAEPPLVAAARQAELFGSEG